MWSSAAFLKAYLQVAGEAAFMPKSEEHLRMLLSSYVLEKLLYELRYELNNRPTWSQIPLRGILQLSETEA